MLCVLEKMLINHVQAFSLGFPFFFVKVNGLEHFDKLRRIAASPPFFIITAINIIAFLIYNFKSFFLENQKKTWKNMCILNK